MTEYPKVSRHCLLPVLPGADAYRQHFGGVVDSQWNVPVQWIGKYADKLSDYVVVTERSPRLVEKVESETGKRAIPSLSTAPSNQEACSVVVPPSEFKPTPADSEWIAYLRSRLDHWPWIMAVNCENDMDTNQGSWPLMKHLTEFVQVFPDMAAKFAYAPWDLALAGEAGAFAEKLDQCQVLKHFLDHKSFVCVYMGYQVLYRSLAEYTTDGYNLSGTVWLHAINRGDRNWIQEEHPESCFPYKNIGDFYKRLGREWRESSNCGAPPVEQASYYAAQRREACAFSGIGFYTGAARHNLSRMVDFGFTGCCFFPPAVDGDEGKRQMDLYTTDVL
jgi:hypothetical protein